MFHYNYEDHVMPFFEVIMMGKSGALYKAVFQNQLMQCGHVAIYFVQNVPYDLD